MYAWFRQVTAACVVNMAYDSLATPSCVCTLKLNSLPLSGELTLIVAAASIDVVIAISLFGVFFGLAFSEGN